MGGWLAGWLYEHENITNSASNSVEVGAGAELGNKKLSRAAKLLKSFN